MSNYLSNLDLGYNQIKRALLDQQGADPSGLVAAQQGYVFFRTDTKVEKVWNGSAFDQSSGAVLTATGTAASVAVGGVSVVSAAVAAGRMDQSLTLSLNAASASVAGSMSSGDYNKLAAATSANAASAIVQRDASGNFSAGTITASLTGTASNATSLAGQAASYYLSRTNHTGTQLAATISDFDTQVRTSRLDQMSAPTAAVSFNGQRLTSLADPTSPQDGATKAYVDSVAAGLDVKLSVKVATTTAGTLTTSFAAGQVVDGYTLVAGDRILIKNQAAGTENGIYVVTVGTPTRATDFNTSINVTPGAFTFVEQGTVNADNGFVLTTDGVITLGTTALVFGQFSGAGTYLAGNGLALTGSTFSVVGTANRIAVSGAGVDISSAYVGQTSITTLGTVTTGTWTGTAIAVANGGTGSTTAIGARTNLGATTKVTGTITGTGAATSFPFVHSLGTIAHSLTMTDASGNITYADFTLGANTDTIVVSQAITNGVVYTITVVG